MTDPTGDAAEARSAGALLREARQAQGLHIAALAATIKVQQRKLEALEADRLDQLPDTTFTRALAQTVCRALKIDAAPVLALLPQPAGHRLEHVGEGLNTPFRDRPGRREPSDWGVAAMPRIWLPLLIVAGAAALYFMPSSWLASLQPGAPAQDAAAVAAPELPAASAVATPPESVPAQASMDAASTPALPPVEPAASMPAPAAVVAAKPVITMPASAASAGVLVPFVPVPGKALQVRASAPSWIEVQDAQSRVLVSRLLQPGEALALDGQPPLKLKVGNAEATEVMFRGQALDLAPSTRDNVARLVLR